MENSFRNLRRARGTSVISKQSVPVGTMIDAYNGALVPYYTTNDASKTINEVDSLRTNRDLQEERLHITGLRRKRLYALLIWLCTLSVLSILLLGLNITLIKVLQMTTQGMRSLKIHSYIDEKTGQTESAVHFAANKIDLGHIIVTSGKVIGERLHIQGSEALIAAGEGNATQFSLQNGQCSFENVDIFLISSGINGKVLFNASNPQIFIDHRIRVLASRQMITSKIRSPIHEHLHVQAENINLRGNEAIYMEARSINATVNTSLNLNTSVDGSIRFGARRFFIGNEWHTLPLSSSPALTASAQAFRVCICTSAARPHLFIVNGNKPCIAPDNLCK